MLSDQKIIDLWKEQERFLNPILKQLLETLDDFRERVISSDILEAELPFFETLKYPLPSNPRRCGNLLGLLLELREWDVACKVMMHNTVSTEVISWQMDGTDSIGVEEFLKKEKQNKTTPERHQLAHVYETLLQCRKTPFVYQKTKEPRSL